MATAKPDIWMPLYVADYLADTAYLTTEQHGAYLLMLMAYWRNGPIPDNDAILAGITRLPPDAWSKARAVLEGFFQVSNGVWCHKRVEAEYDKARRNRQAAHERAATAAKARWERQRMPQAMLQALPGGMLEPCSSPSPSPSQIPTAQSGADAPPANGTGKTKKRLASETTLTDWLAGLGDQEPIRADDPLVVELEAAGVPVEFVELSWWVFVRDWGARKAKDWPATYRNAIRKGWIRLWYFDQQTGECRLNATGELARRAMVAQ
jgi:uncharacterized protein YdaU (DUF1376 family)